MDPKDTSAVELSIVMPCLNEADTLAACIIKAKHALEVSGIAGEVIVADNGSTDGSPEIARPLGARVIPVARRGYGSALMAGIEASRGRYVLMGDADSSYDFGELPKFVAKLREGCDLVQGSRLPSGGGRVMPGAMPWSHRWIGNPFFSRLSRWWFGSPIHDVNCGLRGFTRELYRKLNLRCTGMEFAAEMIIKAMLYHARVAEVPITLYPDGRKAHAPHLRTFRDGWRTLRFLMLYSPRWIFLVPGATLIGLGLIGYGLVLAKGRVGFVELEVNTLLFASVAILCGYQAVLFAAFARAFVIRAGLVPENPRMMRVYDFATLERGLLAGAVVLLAGMVLLLGAVRQWWVVHFGPLEHTTTVHWVVPGATLFALGVQTVLSSFFLSILGLNRQ